MQWILAINDENVDQEIISRAPHDQYVYGADNKTLWHILLMFPPDPVPVDARRWSGFWYTRDHIQDSPTNHRCAKIRCNRA